MVIGLMYKLLRIKSVLFLAATTSFHREALVSRSRWLWPLRSSTEDALALNSSKLRLHGPDAAAASLRRRRKWVLPIFAGPKESASAMDLDCKSTKLSKFLDEWTVNKDLQLQDNSLHMKLNIFYNIKEQWEINQNTQII